MDETEYQLGMARLIRIANRLKEKRPVVQSPEKVGDYHVCKLCGHSWKVRKSSPEPKSCPSCRSTMWNDQFARSIICARCKYGWTTNREKPVMCPNCKCRTYDIPELRIKCRRCGSIWMDKMDWQSTEVICPICGQIPKKEVTVIKNKQQTTPPEVTDEQATCLKEQPDDYSKYVYLKKMGLTPTETDIIMLYLNKVKPVEIALRLDVPLGLVFETIVPYLDKNMEGANA